MIYTDLESLSIAAFQIDSGDKESVDTMRDLIKVYFDALYNPPEGVIGVGAITYAQENLVSYQLNNGN